MGLSAKYALIATLFFGFFSTFLKAENLYDVNEVKPRFESMDCIVKPRFTPVVEAYIKRYLAHDGRLAKIILSRAAVYYPIFEEHLSGHDLPQDLKYLAVLESGLNPKAVSPVGAAGLWQFMAQTGKSLDLIIDKNVDERSCSHNSTNAAMRYMAKQYKNYGSWELALAAYNCGAGNVNRAIKRARTQDYWKLSRFLPRETSNFVPAFLSAAYVGKYYHSHNIEPDYPSLDMQLTDFTMVFDEMKLETIAAIAGIPLEVVEKLNPAFKKDFVPENPRGFHVILPKRTVPALREYLEFLNPDRAEAAELPELPSPIDSADYTPDQYYFNSTYTVIEGDDINELSMQFNCSPYNIRVWNNLSSNELKKGQELEIWFPYSIRHFLKNDEKVEVKKKLDEEPVKREITPAPKKMPALKMEIRPISEIQKSNSSHGKTSSSTKSIHRERESGFIFYHLHADESLLDVAEHFPGVTVQNLLDWNGLSKEKPPVAGMNLRIKRT